MIITNKNKLFDKLHRLIMFKKLNGSLNHPLKHDLRSTELRNDFILYELTLIAGEEIKKK